MRRLIDWLIERRHWWLVVDWLIDWLICGLCVFCWLWTCFPGRDIPFLQNYAHERWEIVLHFLAGLSGANQVSRDTVEVLTNAGLIKGWLFSSIFFPFKFQWCFLFETRGVLVRHAMLCCVLGPIRRKAGSRKMVSGSCWWTLPAKCGASSWLTSIPFRSGGWTWLSAFPSSSNSVSRKSEK